jgi:hypothetical protein
MPVTSHVYGIVEGERVRLPEGVRLPDGLRVRIVWREEDLHAPYDREPLTAADVEADIAWSQMAAGPER